MSLAGGDDFRQLFSNRGHRIGQTRRPPGQRVLALFEKLRLSILLCGVKVGDREPRSCNDRDDGRRSFVRQACTPLVQRFSSVGNCRTTCALICTLSTSRNNYRLALSQGNRQRRRIDRFIPLRPRTNCQLLRCLYRGTIRPRV